jgi:hypothetical protein
MIEDRQKEVRMRKALCIFLVSALFAALACSKKPESAARVEVIDGIEHIHNASTPLHPDRTVSFGEDLSIGGEEYDMLFRPQRFIVDQNENIYITDYQDQSIKVFDPNGEYLHSIGQKGEGPGEFSSVGYLTFLPNGKLMVTDFMARRLSLFEADGTFSRSYLWPEGLGRPHYATDSSCILSQVIFGEKNPLEERKLFVKEFDFQGNEIRSYGEFMLEDGKAFSEKRGEAFISAIVSPPYSPQSVFAADPGRNYLYHCVNNEYRIEVFGNEGKVIKRFDRPYEPLPFTGKDAAEFQSRYENSRLEGLKKMAKGLPMPSVKTVISRMLADDEGNIWAETYEKKEEGDQTFTAYDIFNPEGYYEAKVWIDLKPELFVKGKMYRMHADEETEYIYVKRYRVVWSQ